MTPVQAELFPVEDPTPDLDTYDVILVNTSAGKDSLVMADVIYELLGNDPRIVAVHADLGEMEWPDTRALAERQIARYGWRFIATERTDGLSLLDGIERRGMWPSASARYCTSDWKRGPIRRIMTQLAREHAPSTPCRILSCLGFRAEESRARSLRPVLAANPSASTKTTKHVDEWLPVFRWTANDVWRRIHAGGLEYHPAYDLAGVTRLSCTFCVLAGTEQLEAGIAARPDLAARYAEAEKRMGHTFRHGWSIADAVDRSQVSLAAPTRRSA